MQLPYPPNLLENYCSEIASPGRTKNKKSQRKLYLLSLVEKYYNQAANLPKLQSQWFDRPIVKYQTWRAQNLLNWIRTVKMIICTKISKKKIVQRTLPPNQNIQYQTNKSAEDWPTIINDRVHTIPRISNKKKIIPLITTYFSTRSNRQIEEITEQPAILLQNHIAKASTKRKCISLDQFTVDIRTIVKYKYSLRTHDTYVDFLVLPKSICSAKIICYVCLSLRTIARPKLIFDQFLDRYF